MKKMLTMMFVLLFLSGALFAEGEQEGSNTEKINLRFATTWGMEDSKGAYFIPMLEEFAAQNIGGVNMSIETYSSDELITKVNIELASRSLPDSFSYWGGRQRLEPFVKEGALLNMEEYFKVSDLSKSDFTSAGIEHFTLDGTLVGIPMESNLGSFICNKELFDKFNLKLPETTDDMIAAGKVFQANGIIPFAMSSVGGNPSQFWFSEVYKQYKGGLEEIKGLSQTMRFNTDIALKTSEFIEKFRVNNMYPENTLTSGGYGPTIEMYQEGRAAMIYTYPWALGSMEQSAQDKSVVIDVPQIPGSDIDTSTFISGFATYGFVVDKSSWNDAAKNPVLKRFVDHMVSDKMFNELMKGGLIPTKNYDMPFDAFNTIMQKTLRHYQGRPQTTSHFWNIDNPDNATAMKSGLDELFAGLITPEEYVKQVQTAWDNSK